MVELAGAIDSSGRHRSSGGKVSQSRLRAGDQQRHAGSHGYNPHHRRNGQHFFPIGCRGYRTDVDDRLTTRVGDTLIDEGRQSEDDQEHASDRDGLQGPPQSCRTTLNSELLILMGSSPLYSMNPSFLNLFRKKFTRERVVPTISARVSCEIFGTMRTGTACLP